MMLAEGAGVPLARGLTALMLLWPVVGFGFALTQTPIDRMLNRSAWPEDRPAVFAAQFALSHAAWLVTDPLAGRVEAAFRLPAAALLLVALGGVSLAGVIRLWPKDDPDVPAHDHPDLPAGHPHLAEDGLGHAHTVVIDPLHLRWPGRVA